MARALVVFESMFGNTEAIARAVADGLGGGAEVDVVGGPTHAFGMSRPSTRRSAAQQAEALEAVIEIPNGCCYG